MPSNVLMGVMSVVPDSIASLQLVRRRRLRRHQTLSASPVMVRVMPAVGQGIGASKIAGRQWSALTNRPRPITALMRQPQKSHACVRFVWLRIRSSQRHPARWTSNTSRLACAFGRATLEANESRAPWSAFLARPFRPCIGSCILFCRTSDKCGYRPGIPR